VARRRLIVPLVVLALLGGVTLVMIEALGDLEPYVHVDEIARAPERWVGKGVIQVRGFARNVPARATLIDQQPHREFDLEKEGLSVHVRHVGVVPDNFNEQRATTVRGTVRIEGGRPVIETVGGEKGVVTKCPSKYEGRR
jgi:cytochrome c-type biogenesis protein CcmE